MPLAHRSSFGLACVIAFGLSALAACSGGTEAVIEPEAPGTAGAAPLVDSPDAHCGPTVDIDHELLVTNAAVLTDPRTTNGGPWSFEFLMRSMTPAGQDPSDFVLSWLEQWETVHTVNGFPLNDSSAIRSVVIDPWLARSVAFSTKGHPHLDLSKAPFRLLAIVDRVDLRSSAYNGNAGEGRFVFQVTDGGNFDLRFTAIFEFGLPSSGGRNALYWASQWHALSAIDDAPTFGPHYRSALEAITRAYSGPNVLPEGINGSSLHALRTNEIAFTNPWNIREFNLQKEGLRFAPVKQTPFNTFNSGAGATQLASFLVANRAAVLDGTYQIPTSMLGSESDETITWNPGNLGATDPALRTAFAANTCNGCHNAETGSSFYQIGPGVPQGSHWLRTVDLPRRQTDLELLLCGGADLDARTTATRSPPARGH